MSKAADITLATTLQVRDRCLCLHVQRAARRLARHFDNALRPLGLNNGQFSLLHALNRPEPATMSSVTAVLAMDRTTLTAALKPLERRGIVEVTIDPQDRRSRLLTLTHKGKSLLAEAMPVWRRTHAHVERLLGGADPELLRSGLRALS
jgi:DNA-binding MarR family transcriptional regulator